MSDPSFDGPSDAYNTLSSKDDFFQVRQEHERKELLLNALTDYDDQVNIFPIYNVTLKTVLL